MKSAYKFLLAAFAATVALASCTKDIAADRQDTDPQDGLRKIAVSFGTPTKTVLGDNGLKPEFVGGEEIAITDGNTTKYVYVQGTGEKAFFQTDLRGKLTAIYPAKAAVIDKSNVLDGSVKIEIKQSGLFEKANIARAYIGEKENTARFENQTAVLKFYVGPEIGVETITISSTDQEQFLATPDGTQGGTITVDVAALHKMEGHEGDRICYVAVFPYDDISFDVVSATETQGTVNRSFQQAHLAMNTLTNIFIPYYIETEDGQKWAYCNIGAFLPEEAGEYFAWGDTMGAKYLPKEDPNTPFVGDSGARFFSWSECPFNGGKDTFNDVEFKNAVVGGAVLDGVLALNNDAANIKWGEGWRMPTMQEFDKLMTGVSYSSEYGDPFTVGSLRLPVTGYAMEISTGKTSFEWQDAGVYWTSSLNGTDSSKAYCFTFGPSIESSTNCEINPSFTRKFGFPIRPIYDSQGGSDEPGPDGPDSDGGMTFSDLTEHSENI